MDFHRFSKHSFRLALLAGMAMSLSFWGLLDVWGGFSSSLSMLVFGFGFTYLMATSFLGVRTMQALMGFQELSWIHRFPKTIAILITVVVLVAQSSALFGAYFNNVDSHGFESSQLIDLDRYLRKILKLQLIAVPLAAAYEAPRGRWWDFALATFAAIFLAMFVLG